ncbi:hypothetical protein GFC01_06050 [Desulfofundulus thermobenzoicus]|uniref:TrbL/VirB6 plasmid conjugal transfer protein n=1 Tax=Desulfofundulus thermobenzoicus TaxID=29376 RepID=A0A6N7IP82_9FIRM|nr:hypothetical protein [Desulfofundulus thermobenzoicus]MQL51832.1 hypothetical protein [Desulfofundulus thermobenzoicus]
MRKFMAVFVLLFLIFSMLAPAAVFAADSGASSSGSSSTQSNSGGGGGDGGESWLARLVHAVERAVDAILNFPSRLADALLKAMSSVFFNMIGSTVDAILQVMDGILAVAFLNTTLLYNIPWVLHGNAIVWIICLVVAVLFLTLDVFHILHGRKDAVPVLLTFGAAILLSVFSIQIVDIMIWFSNTTANTLGQGALNALSAAAHGVSLKIGSLTGDQIVSFPFQNPQTLGTAIPFHNNFITPVFSTNIDSNYVQGSGGVIGYCLAAAGWLLLCLLCLARLFVICVGAMLAPLYISFSIIAARLEPAVGWLALMLRSVFVQLLWVFVWTAMIWANVSYSTQNLKPLLGLSAAGVNMILLFVTAYLTYRFWAKPSVAQIKKPLSLAGGVILEKVGQFGETVGQLVSVAGMLTGQPEVVAAGNAVRGGSGKVKNYGARAREYGAKGMFDLSGRPPEEESRPLTAKGMDALKGYAEKRYREHMKRLAEEKDEEGKPKHKLYWTKGEKFIVKDPITDLPQEVPVRPKDHIYAGEWSDK